MKCIKPSLYYVAFFLPLCLNCVTLSAFAAHEMQLQAEHTKKTWLLSQGFKPPQRGNPPVSAGGSTRSSSCISRNKQITPLVPPNKLGLTFAKYPTFFWHIPTSVTKTAKLTILTDKNQTVFYETSFTLPGKPGIISFTLPNSAPALAVGKTYRWKLTVVCDAEDDSGNPSVDAWVERTQPELRLSQALAKADSRKLPTIYAEAGIWHEALTTLVKLRRAEPNNSKIKMDWQKFLQSVGLDAIVKEPFINCCTNDNSSQ
ncbi:hypothetical protein NIES2101_25655 [Calothrix sp. HK-06]|nr:hypothetical protein NIES2101_25655 [Calothrix sp. HK-06]